MKEIWAPWRVEYFKQPKDAECFLCKAFREENDRENHVVTRGEASGIVLNRYPYTGGHLMVCPYRHLDDLKVLSVEETSEMWSLVVRAIEALKKTIQPHGFNVGLNIGEAAGAGLKDHLHLHVVPRWTGDTNFMTILDDVRVVPQGLNEMWDALREVID